MQKCEKRTKRKLQEDRMNFISQKYKLQTGNTKMIPAENIKYMIIFRTEDVKYESEIQRWSMVYTKRKAEY